METGPGRITLWAIEIFVATADEGSISAAARRLGASPSAVSQQLTNLEAAVGASLASITGVAIGHSYNERKTLVEFAFGGALKSEEKPA